VFDQNMEQFLWKSNGYDFQICMQQQLF